MPRHTIESELFALPSGKLPSCAASAGGSGRSSEGWWQQQQRWQLAVGSAGPAAREKRVEALGVPAVLELEPGG
jgi:hypothetical protein